jgi:hypothetical protein
MCLLGYGTNCEALQRYGCSIEWEMFKTIIIIAINVITIMIWL